MEQCFACGAALAADAGWCGQCYQPRGRAATAPLAAAQGSIMAPARRSPAATLPPRVIHTRWRKTQTTFGPLGRILVTIAVLIPLTGFALLAWYSRGLTIGGIVVWGLVIAPLVLRDAWKAGQLTLP